MNIKPFKCVRPDVKVCDKVAALPYDVYSREEAAAEVEGKPLSFLNIDRPETQFEPEHDMYADDVYAMGAKMLQDEIGDGTFVCDDEESYYLYELTMNGRAQTGIVACASIDDYVENRIKKHENTRADKEQDRIRHVDTLSAQTGPIFLAYRNNAVLKSIVSEAKKSEPLYSFTSEDGISHVVWKIADADKVAKIKETFAGIDSIYIADGHHRAASAVKVGLKRRNEAAWYEGNEEFNFFLSVIFPDDELMIMPYNRVVRDLNGCYPKQFFEIVSKDFDIKKIGKEAYEPTKKGTFGMFVDDEWYELTAHEDILSDDPVKGLDVSILQDHLLAPILGIDDPRTDKRIEFVGGIRGTAFLEKRVHDGMAVAFSMYPTSIAELFSVADAGLLMPPKSTWFEPKLRSGIFIHQI